MQALRILSVGVAGVILSAPTTVAQEKQEKKPAKAVRAVRLTAAGMLGGKPPTQEELKKRHAAKLDGAWVKNANWITDYDQAKASAATSGKQILAYFTRSYAP